MDKEYESTFDNTRTITGRADKGSVITINVCAENEDDILTVVESHEIEVGLSGYFSTSVNLYEGENLIVISNEDNSASVVAFIKRKSEEIKARLERGVYSSGVALPYIPFSVD